MGNGKPQKVTFAVCSSRLNRRKGFQWKVIYGKVFCHKKLYSLAFKGMNSLFVSVCDVFVGFLISNQLIIADFWAIKVMHFNLMKTTWRP